MDARLAPVTIGVLGSGTDAHETLGRGLGELLAELGVNLLTGGGAGVMTTVARAFTSSRRTRGISIGIVPCRSARDRARPPDGYPNAFVELPIYTHLPFSGARGTDDLSRNHINVLSSTALVALPGAEGTASEIALAVTYRKPMIAYGWNDASAETLPADIPRAATLDEVRTFLRAHAGAVA